MNKTIWTPEKIAILRKLLAQYGYKRVAIAYAMGMTYNQINSALRRFCKEGK